MSRTRTQVGRAQAGGLSLLLAVALLAAAGSGVDTARRVASAGAGLAYAMVVEPPRVPNSELAAGSELALVGVAERGVCPSVVVPALSDDRTGALVRSGLIDLPPPSMRVL